MSNPMLQMLNQNQKNNPIEIFSQVKNFVKGMTPQGAEQRVNEMLQSGQITQEKLNEAINTAQKIQKMIGK